METNDSQRKSGRAAIFHGPNDIRLVNRPTSALEDFDLLLKIGACGVCGTDVRVFRQGHRRVNPPRVLGHEISGEIVEVGSGIDRFNVGDRVIVKPSITCGRCKWCLNGEQNLCEEKIAFAYELDGGFADHMLIKNPAYVNGLILKHDGTLTHEAATLIEPLSCVLHGQKRVNPTTNENTVIIGAGPIGAMHMLLSKEAGARTIISEKFPDRLDLMEQFGADELINSQEVDPVKRVREITGGHGAEVVIVCASSQVCQQQALRMASKKGRVLFFAGLPPSVTEVPLETNLIHYRDLTVLGSFESSFKDFEDALRIVKSGRPNIKALITHRIPLDDILEAIQLVETGKAIKVVVTTQNANTHS